MPAPPSGPRATAAPPDCDPEGPWVDSCASCGHWSARWTRAAGDLVLHLTHVETIGVRELQQHASAALRRVERGETIGVTDRGRLVAILAPPSSATGAGALMASGRVQPATRSADALPEPVAAARTSAEVLDELRDER